MTDRDRRHLEAIPPEPPEHDGPPPPPNDRHAERVVLGAMLRDRQAVLEVTELLEAEHFYTPRHELIFEAMRRRMGRLESIDVGLVADDLRRAGDLGRCGGHTYLHELFNDGLAAPTDVALHYADIVRDTAARRRLVEAGTRIAAMGWAPTEGTAADIHTRALAELDRDRILQPVPGIDDDTTHPWAALDLDEILTSDTTGPAATVGARRDGKKLLYPGAIHSVSGEPGGGKTWFGQIIAAQEIDDDHDVTIIDFEDRPQTHVARLRALGVTDDQLRTHLRYIRPHAALDAAGWPHLQQACATSTLVIVDGITEAMTLHGLSLMDNEDAARWIALLPRRVADLGAAVLQVDHVVKNSESRGRYAIGAQHKLAALDGVAYKLLTIRSFGQGNHGHAKLVIDKDRHGDVGPNGTTAADIHLDATAGDGSLYGWLDSPARDHDENGQFRPTVLMERVSNYLYATPRPLSLNDIKKGVKGSNDGIAQAVDALVREGCIRVEDGPRGSTIHHLIEAFPRRSDD